MPDSPHALARRIDHVRELIGQGHLRAAGQACQDLVTRHPEHAPAWIAFSELWLRCGQYHNAFKCAEKATRLDPDATSARAQLAKTLTFQGELNQALETARKALDMTPITGLDLDTLGNVLGQCGDHDAALAAFERAAELDPGNPNILYNLATSARIHGRTEQAEEIYDRLINLNPDDFEAYYSRSLLRRQSREHNHVGQLAERLDRTSGSNARVHLYYALAKEYEDLEDYARSFNALQAGADLRDAQLAYKPDADRAAVDTLIAGVTPELIAARARQGCPDNAPIFVLGLPRTGTTLVERILGSHSQVLAAGELPDFQVALSRQLGAGPAESTLGVAAGSIERIDYPALGRSYLGGVQARHGATRFTDKTPNNFLFAGLIHLALPRARIILLERHPMDACYAMYKTLFRHAYPFSYNLEKLAHHYLDYRRLSDHWLSILPDQVITRTSYERLVRHPEPETRRLLAFCDLPWEEDCLRFHQRSQAVATASAQQVRQPIYQTSIGKWQRYADQLAPLRSILENAGIEI